MCKVNFARIIVCALVYSFVVVKSEEWQEYENEPLFGFGAEDDANNELPVSYPEGNNYFENNGNIKASRRQDTEDVEMLLSSEPMLAPDIIMKRYVDSRVSLTNIDSPIGANLVKNNSIMNDMDDADATDAMMSDVDNEIYEFQNDPQEEEEEDPEEIISGLIQGIANAVNAITSAVNKESKISKPKQSSKQIKCEQKFNGAVGSFTMDLSKDCTIHILNPDIEARVLLTCSPIPLGDCATHKDNLAINLMGDLNFKQNSFLYCGKDANIRATSIRNQLAIRIKKSKKVTGSTFCTYNSRKEERDYEQINADASCGKLGRIAKIVGGRSVPPGLFPWAVQLDITRIDGSQTGCTGTIVAPYYVLTAAHCMKRSESVSAFMGGTDRHDIVGGEVLIQAEKYILHKKWSQRTLVADIALVKLTQPVHYTEDISPICLPEGKLLYEDMSGRRGVAIGWGRTQTKRKAPRKLYRIKLPLLDDVTCKDIYRRFFIPNVMMCTDSKPDAAICYGMDSDSGGPLMYKRKDKVYQIGVASFSLSKTCGASPDVFTKVGEFVDWVEKRLAGVPVTENE